MKKLSLLVVDDDDLVHKSIEMSLPDQWRMSSHYSSENLPQGSFLAAFVDMHFSKKMDKAEGLQVIRKLSEAFPHLEIIAMSGDLDRALMEDCLAAGASRFIAKPLSLKEIQLLLDKIEALHLMHLAATRQGGKKIQWIGNGQESKKIRQKIAHFRGEPGPILICGESGTGKEVATTLLHEQEGENRPFIRLNVAAVPETLFESELFGHVKGAFTGADQNKMGLAEAANGGDLFLDEIEALSLPLQVKLLRFLESNEVR
ncbi:MAG: sigma-54-dependent Fis family transcriptional regulator, partial [Bdellovibrionales bacterium]|nr:sigma-54-dependent Fis family transcriptional regulator [Bdellovibrionales bacterium]